MRSSPSRGPAAFIIVTVGLTVGSVAGYYGRWVDDSIMWFINTLNSIPFILLLLIVSLLFKPSALTLTIFIGLISWTEISRIVRGQVLPVKQMEYVTAAHAIGVPTLQLVVRHIIPNVIPVVIIYSAQIIGGVILVESALSFLGLGVQPPTPSWGTMVDAGRGVLLAAWWLSTFPGLAIVFTQFNISVLAVVPRDALHPRLRE